MSDYTWDQVDVDENITEEEQKQSNDLSIATPVGQFLCSIVECIPIEKNFEKYTCMAAKLKMKIDGIIKLEQPLINTDGSLVKRDGEVVMKIQAIPAEKRSEFEALILGQLIFDEVNLYHPKEKDATKRRRLFVAKKFGLISPNAQSIGSREWAGSPGKQALVSTEWNHYKAKDTGEAKKNVRVAWSGYDFAGEDPAGQAGPRGTSIDSVMNDFSGI